MKTKIVVLLLIAAITMFQLFNSCRHELPHDYCQTNPIQLTATSTGAIANQSNGTITATATGGLGFKYSLNDGPFQDTGYFAGLSASQNYTVLAKNSWGCYDTAFVIVNSINPCEGVIVVVNVTKTDATSGQSNGTVTASATGGSGFTYSINGTTFQSSGAFSGLAAGNYTVTAKNSNGCTGTSQVTIGVNNPCSGITVAVTTTQVNPAIGQSNGSITAAASGGTGFTYSLNNGAFQNSGLFSGLAEGIYTITAKNSNGCTGIKQVTLTAVDPCTGVTVTVTTTQVNPTTGQSNGSITATATGGTGFTYSLNSGTYQASGTFTGLATGNYTITAKNSNGCTGLTQVALGSTNPCTGVTVTVTTTQVNPTTGQSNGSITASATGGTGFTYSLNGGAYQASGTFTALAAGTYTISAKNSNGCLGSTQVTLSAANPCTNTTITVSSVVVNYTPCLTPASGKITVTAAGSSGFTYNLNNGAYQASNIFSNLTAAAYTIGVKDLNGCTKTATATVGTAASGPLFAAVRNIITTRCSGSGCHMNGANAAGYNFDADCSVVSQWSKINSSSVTGNNMPKSPQAKLTTAEKQAITNWINAGHLYTN